MNHFEFERKSFLRLLAAVSIAFVWVVWPYIGAVFWATVLAIVFAPLHRWLLRRMPRRPTLAALATMFVCLVGVGVPLTLLASSLLHEGLALYSRMASGEVDLGGYFRRIVDALLQRMPDLLDALDLGDVAAIQQRLSAAALRAGRFLALHALGIGQNTFEFLLTLAIMLYLLFFLLRDGSGIVARIERAIPLRPEHKRSLFDTFATVVRATVKGSVVMAVVQGALGGVMLWFLGIEGPLLWGVVFGLLSTLPAVGAGILWAPIAVYFLFTGAAWKGLTLIIFGSVVLTAVDNTLRPILVGSDTHLPGYLVLISTIGGIASCGLNGFVIGPVIAALFIGTWDLFSSARAAQLEQAIDPAVPS